MNSNVCDGPIPLKLEGSNFSETAHITNNGISSSTGWSRNDDVGKPATEVLFITICRRLKYDRNGA
jgi:hypothetical protein